jgi:hypothetical protein
VYTTQQRKPETNTLTIAVDPTKAIRGHTAAVMFCRGSRIESRKRYTRRNGKAVPTDR